MDEDLANIIILSVKSNREELSQRQQLDLEIRKIREAGMEFFAKLYCKKNFGHADISRIPDSHIPLFIDYIEEFVAVGLAVGKDQV